MTIGQFLCSLTGGHDRIKQFEANRITLKCIRCGHETHGWELGGPRPACREQPSTLVLQARRVA